MVKAPPKINTKPAPLSGVNVARMPIAKAPVRGTAGALTTKPPTKEERMKRDAQRRASAQRGRESRMVQAPQQQGAQPFNVVQPSVPPSQGGIPYNDPTGIAGAQDFYNRQNIERQIDVNRFNESNPYGSKTFIQNPDGSYTKNVSLSDPQQRILDASQNNEIATQGAYGGALGAASGAIQKGLNFNGLQSLDPQNDATRQRYEQSLVDRQTKLLKPQFDAQLSAQVDDLRARGIQEGSPEFEKRMGMIRDQQGRQLSDIASAATLQGGQEASQMLQNQLGVRGQQGSERQAEYGAPLNALGTISGLRQGVSNPAFENTAGVNVGTVDAAGIGGQFAGMGFQGSQADLARQFDAQQQASQNQFAAGQTAIGNRFTASQAALERAAAMERQRIASRNSGGGGAAPRDPIADYEAKARIDQMYAPKPPKPANPIYSVGGNILGQGLSALIGSQFK